jgi:hypothetical protein
MYWQNPKRSLLYLIKLAAWSKNNVDFITIFKTKFNGVLQTVIIRGNCKSPPFVIPNEVRNLKGLDIKRFLPLVEMTIDAFLSFAIPSLIKGDIAF